MKLISVFCMMAGIAFVLDPPLLADTYEPVMPKNGRTLRVIVIDFSQSKSKAESISLACLQGLVNRDSEDKIYVKGWPTRIFSHPELSEFERGGGVGDVYEMMLDLIPYPQQRVNIPSGQFSALKWLLDRHQEKVKGLVLVSERSDGSAAAGINACTFESLLPVTARVRDAIARWGYDFETEYDVSQMSNIEATRWSIERYMADPRRVKHVLNYSDPLHLMNDYVVSNFIFSYRLEGKKNVKSADGTTEEVAIQDEPALLEELYAPGNFAPGAMNIGGAEGPKLIPHLSDFGAFCVCGHAGNCSVTSSIPTSPDDFPPMPKGRSLPADSNSVFITFSGNDGDAIDFGLYCATKNFVNDPHAGQIPMSWKINPIYIDLFPSWYRFHLGRYENVEIAGSFNDGGCPSGKRLPPERQAAAIAGWEQLYGGLIKNSAGSMRQFCVLGRYCGGTSRTVRFLHNQGADYVYRGYDGKTGNYNGRTRMALVGQETVVSNLVGLAPSGPEDAYRQIKRSLGEFNRPNRPMFLMVRLGVTWVENNDQQAVENLLDVSKQSGVRRPNRSLYLNARRGILPFTMAKSIMNLLEQDQSIQRKITYVNPRDFAATYRQWAIENRIPNDARRVGKDAK